MGVKRQIECGKITIIPVADMSGVCVSGKLSEPGKWEVGITIGPGDDGAISDFKIVRRNPPSRKYPKGSLTVRAIRNTDAGPIEGPGLLKIV